MPSSSFPVDKTVGAISCTTMTLFTKCYPPPLGTRINNTVPALKTTTVNRPVPALKKKVPALKKKSRREQKIQPPRLVPPRKKILPPRPASEKKTTAPSRLGKEKKTPRPASGKKSDRPVPPRKKKTTAPSRLKKKNNRPVPSRQEFCPEKYRPVPSRQEFPPLYFASPALPPNEKGGSTVNFPPVPSRWDFSRPCKALKKSQNVQVRSY